MSPAPKPAAATAPPRTPTSISNNPLAPSPFVSPATPVQVVSISRLCAENELIICVCRARLGQHLSSIADPTPLGQLTLRPWVSRHPTSMDDPNSTPMLRPDGTLTVSSLPGMDGPEFYFLRDCSTQSGIAEIAARKSESKQRNLPLIRESEDRIAPGELSSCSNNLRIGALGSEP